MKIIGHRGARGLAPENTSFSLQKALQHLRYSVDMIEFDVRVTKDDVPILHHDAAVISPGGQKLRINQNSYKELQAHFPDLTTLSQALDLIDTKVTAYIEVKPGEPTKQIVAKLKEHIKSGMYGPPNFRLASKSQKTLRQLHAALPDIPKIVIEPWSGTRAIRRAQEVETKEIAMNQLWLWSGFIKHMARGGWQLYPYTLNNLKKARRWEKYGIAGVITDHPDRFEISR